MKQVLILAAFLSSSAAFAEDPPGIAWEKEYVNPTVFLDVLSTSDGRIVCSGGTTTGLDLWCYDEDGNQLWVSGGGGSFARSAMRVVQTPSGGFAVAGTCTLVSGGMHDLYVSTYTSTGQAIWTTVIQRPATQDYGYDITCLPDGGFAACGYTQDPVLSIQAWVLRLDSQGDTLWTRTWGPTSYPDKAFALEYTNGGITVLVQGKPSGYTQGRPLLLRYSLEGDLPWVSMEMIGQARDLCRADQGYCILRSESSATNFISRCDASGGILWNCAIVCDGQEEMHSIAPTMDGGFLVSGADDYVFPEPVGQDWNAHLSRYDQDGNWMWTSSIEPGDGSIFYSATQLSQGGYVACGQYDGMGYLVRYEPETGIEEGDQSLPALNLHPCIPNPCSSLFSINWIAGFSGASRVSVYDVSGRLQLEQDLGMTPAGEQTAQLDMQVMPAGCYLVVVSCGAERAATKLVKLP